ncbi:hypothetical protein DWX22_05615 [Coprococcus sp. AF18-48]|nr:hypothetical protein DWX22_05615 [Coprococcus sp. AF18-48]
MRRLQRLCRNLSDGQKRSELTVERRREYNKNRGFCWENLSVKGEPDRNRLRDSRRKKNVSR